MPVPRKDGEPDVRPMTPALMQQFIDENLFDIRLGVPQKAAYLTALIDGLEAAVSIGMPIPADVAEVIISNYAMYAAKLPLDEPKVEAKPKREFISIEELLPERIYALGTSSLSERN